MGLVAHSEWRIRHMVSIKNDEGHQETEKVLEDIEKRIAKEYKQAEKEVAEKLDKYMKAYERKDAKKRELLRQGLITEKEYNEWKIGQIAMGYRWEEMRQTLAEDFTHADQIARSIAGDHMPEVYAINHNYGTYIVEKNALVDTSYTLYDRQTVERLADASKNIIPVPGQKISKLINEGKAVRWNNQQIQSVMMQSILQGESMPKIAKRLAKEVGEKNRRVAVRNARTLTTGVQNAGRVDSFKRGQKLGIELEQQWLATLDGRTRHEHRMLDGQTAPVGGKFKVEGYEIEFPGDPKAPGFLIYNCRCTLIASTKGFEKNLSDLSLRYDEKLGGMSYNEWKYEHKYDKIKYAENFDELANYIETQMWPMVMDKSVRKLDFISVKEAMEGVERVYKDMPGARDYFRTIKAGGRGFMEAGFDGTISFNATSFKYKGSAKYSVEHSTPGFHPKNEAFSIKPYGAHEAGHILESALIKESTRDMAEQRKMWINCTKAEEIVKEACEEVRKKSGMSWISDENLQDRISSYARKDCAKGTEYSETLAEACFDYVSNGANAEPLSKEIWNILKRRLR